MVDFLACHVGLLEGMVNVAMKILDDLRIWLSKPSLETNHHGVFTGWMFCRSEKLFMSWPPDSWRTAPY